MTTVVRFDSALAAACAVVRRHASDLGPRQALLRDLYGYIALLVDRPADDNLSDVRAELHHALGAYSPGEDGVLIGRGDMASLDEVLNDPDAVPADDEEPLVLLVERQLVGRDWLRGNNDVLADPPRLVFYGIKGGVGRSTALSMTAWRLAQLGKRVLIVDLDLESPGVSTLLLPEERLPKFGVVDWLVESAVGQGDQGLLDDLIVPSPLAADSAGQIFVAPAGGRDPRSYAAKLARAYMTVSTPEGRILPFAERLDAMVSAMTGFREVDAVLLDSRAGLHEIAAAAVTHLGAQTLLFATGSEQTFWAYETLFRELRRSPRRARAIRERLKLVSALVPTGRSEAYLQEMLERSYDLFRDNLYDEISAGELDGFSFDLDDPEAPHFPLSVFWGSEFTTGFNPIRTRMRDLLAQANATFGSLFEGIELLLQEATR